MFVLCSRNKPTFFHVIVSYTHSTRLRISFANDDMNLSDNGAFVQNSRMCVFVGAVFHCSLATASRTALSCYLGYRQTLCRSVSDTCVYIRSTVVGLENN